MFRPLHSPSGLYQGHGSCFDHSALSRSPDTLDDWLVHAPSRVEALRARDLVLTLCHYLGIVINLEKSRLSPSQTSSYLGMTIESWTLRAFLMQERVQKLLSQIEEFLSCRQQSVVCSRGSPPYEVTPVVVAESVGFPGRVGFGHRDTLDCTRSVLVVRRLESSRRGLSGAPSTKSSVLVRRFRSRSGGLSRGPVGLRSPVSRGTQDVHQLARTSCSSHVTFIFASPFRASQWACFATTPRPSLT